MSADEYVPSDEDMIHWFEGEENPELARDLWNTWLAAHDARVRRDAALSTYAAAYRVGWLDGQNGSMPDPRMAYPEESP